MNKHVSKLQKEASEARKQIEDSDSDSSDSEDEGRTRRKTKPLDRPTEEQVRHAHSGVVRSGHKCRYLPLTSSQLWSGIAGSESYVGFGSDHT